MAQLQGLFQREHLLRLQLHAHPQSDPHGSGNRRLLKWNRGEFTDDEEDPSTYREEGDSDTPLITLDEMQLPIRNPKLHLEYERKNHREITEWIVTQISTIQHEIRNDIVSYNVEIESKSQILDALYNQSEDLNDEINELKNQLIAQETEKLILNTKKATIDAEIQQLKQFLEPYETLETALKVEIEDLEKIRNKRMRIQVEREFASQDILRLQLELDRMKQISNDRTKEPLHALVNLQETEKKRLEEILDNQAKAQKQLERVTFELGELIAQSAQKQSAVDKERMRFGTLLNRQLELATNLDQKRQEIENLEKELEKQLKTAASQSKDLEQLRATNKILEQKNREKAKADKKLQQEAALLKTSLDSSEKMVDDLEKRKNFLDQRIEAMRKQLMEQESLKSELQQNNLSYFDAEIEKIFSYVSCNQIKKLKNYFVDFEGSPTLYCAGKSLLSFALERIRKANSEESFIAREIIKRGAKVTEEEKESLKIEDIKLKELLETPERFSYLYEAILDKSPLAFTYLKTFCGNINGQDEKGNSFLHLAVNLGNEKLAQALLKKGANLTLPNQDQKTALDLAGTSGPMRGALDAYQIISPRASSPRYSPTHSPTSSPRIAVLENRPRTISLPHLEKEEQKKPTGKHKRTSSLSLSKKSSTSSSSGHKRRSSLSNSNMKNPTD